MKGWAELTPGVFGTKNGKEYRRLEFRDSSEKEKRNEISGGRNTL